MVAATVTTYHTKAGMNQGLDVLLNWDVLKVERQYEELYKKIKRWTYKGRPTRKVRKLHALKQKEGMLASRALVQLQK